MPHMRIAARRGTSVSIDGETLLGFAGCDYLGLSQHPEVIARFTSALATWGVSSSAARATSGNTLAHEHLETQLAAFLGYDSVALLPEGFLANCALIESLRGDHDIALVDAAAHPSLFAAIRMSSMPCDTFAHAQLAVLATKLEEHARRRPLVVTDGVFPGNGAVADVRALLARLPRDARLLVDDCHGVGILGARGAGTIEHHGVGGDARLVLTGTLSKALGCYGGFVAAPAALIERLRAVSTCYLTTTPLPPAVCEAADTALSILRRHELQREREPLRATLARNVAAVRELFGKLSLPLSRAALPFFAITPPSVADTTALAARLRHRGVFVPVVEYPGGPQPIYLRLTVTALHTLEEIERLAEALS
ncbi:MAG: aminotransferase class I/II-fold pyridoxal phosphate-dependent enzyme [Planctomycetota bacterium]